MLERIGAAVRVKLQGFFYGMGFFLKLLKETGLFVRRHQVGYKVLIMQILFTGFEALGIVGMLALGIGAAINIVGTSFLPSFGQSDLMYPILIAVITRELGPLLTAFVIIARSGTAIATELGGMVVSHEVEAYLSFGIQPISFLAVPRLIGVIVSMLVLNIYFNIFGLLGSYGVLLLVKPIAPLEYFQPLSQALRWSDIAAGLTKSLCFGFIVAAVSIYQGLSVQKASTEIPVAGIKAVGQGFAYCMLADVLISAVYYTV